jgi:hypothetical protein
MPSTPFVRIGFYVGSSILRLRYRLRSITPRALAEQDLILRVQAHGFPIGSTR